MIEYFKLVIPRHFFSKEKSSKRGRSEGPIAHNWLDFVLKRVLLTHRKVGRWVKLLLNTAMIKVIGNKSVQ